MKNKWVKGSVRVVIVDAKVCGPLAIHSAIDASSNVSVSHRESGALIRNFGCIQNAEWFADRLMDLALDQLIALGSDPPSNQRDTALATAVKSILAEMRKVNGGVL